MSSDLCHYVPLSSYNWKLTKQYNGPGEPPCLPWNPTVYCTIAGFHGATLWMTIELTLQLLFTFKRRSSLYFWSMIISTWGTALITVGFVLGTFRQFSPPAIATMIGWGWVSMVTPFSLVLYSRLHLILYNRKVLRITLIVIIVDAFIVHTPQVVAGYVGPKAAKVFHYSSYLEVIFMIQEIVLSTLYIYVYMKLMRECRPGEEMKSTLFLLVIAQLVILIADTALCTLLYLELFLARLIILSFVYAVKLKIEFVVLGRLVRFSEKNGDFQSREFAEPKPTSGKARLDWLSLRSTSIPTNGVLDGEIILTRGYEVVSWPRAVCSKTKMDIHTQVPAITLPDHPLTPSLEPWKTASDLGTQDSSASSEISKSIDRIERQYLGRYGMV